jgi:hypothetical protein
MVRTALYEAANVMLSRPTRFSAPEALGMEVARRRGLKRAKVALARKLAGVLHRMWADGTEFRWGKERQAAARRRHRRIGFRAGTGTRCCSSEVPSPGRGRQRGRE